MSSRYDILRAVQERPGMQLREIANALGFDDRGKIAALSVPLTCLAKDKRLRHDGATRGRKYYPTAKTQAVLDHAAAPKPAKPAKAKPKTKTYASPLARAPKPASRIDCRAKPKPKPTAAQQLQIVPKKPDITVAAPPPSRFETVEEFLARGGKIQRLPNGASGEPLFESMRARNDRLLTRLDAEPDFP